MIETAQNRYAMFPFFVVGVVFLLLAPVFWLNTELPPGAQISRSYENAGLYQWVYPSFHYGFGRLRAGELPLWNSRQLCGTPFLANPATGLFQPLNMVFLFLRTERAMAVQAFLGLFLGGLFFVLFARALDVGYVAAVIGGITYAFRGASAAAMSRPELVAALAWTPLVFWAIREFPRDGRYGAAVLGGIGAAMLLLAGSFPMAVGTLLLAIPYAVLCAVVHGEGPQSTPGRRWLGLLIMAGIALAVSAVQWLPAVAWLVRLETPGSVLGRLDVAGRTVTRLRDVVTQFLSAERGVLPRLGYMGVAPLILTPIAFLHRTGRRDAVFFALCAIVLFPLSTLGHIWSAGAFPFEALTFPATLCVVILATLGAGRLFMVGRDIRSPLEWAPALLVLAASVVLLGVGSAAVRGRLIPLILALLPFLVVRVRWLGAVSGTLVAMSAFVDLYSAGMNYYQHPYRDARESFGAHADVMKAAGEQALGGRVLIRTHALEKGLSANFGMLSPVLAAGGVHFPVTHEEAHWWRQLQGPDALDTAGQALEAASDAVNPVLLNYMAVRVLLMTSDRTLALDAWARYGVKLRRSRKENGVDLYINDTARPRASWVPNWRTVPDVDAAIAALTDPAFDGARECVVQVNEEEERLLSIVAPESVGAEAAAAAEGVASCAVEEERAERVVVRVDAPRAGVTVLADTFDPGWRATLDGTPMPVLRVNGIFRGVATPAGSHAIVFRYSPLSFWAGLAISLAGLGVLTIAGLATLVRRF